MAHVDFYFDFISPYAYFAWRQIRDICRRNDATLTVHPVLFAAVLDRSIDESAAGRGARLILHPEDHETLRTREADRVARWSEEYGLGLEDDASLERGAFRVETPSRGIDAQPDSIRERLQEALLEALETGLPEGSI